MKKIAFYLLLFSQLSLGKCAITYDFNGGRFGDCLSTYAKAKWFALKYKLPLFYKPFQYSEQLNLHIFETAYNPKDCKFFNKIVKVKSEADITNNTDDNILFISNFYSITPDLYEYRFIDKKWETEIRKSIAPTAFSSTSKLENTVTIALHVRKGGGFDQPLSTDSSGKDSICKKFSDQIWPTKFPPDEYYIEALAKIAQLIDPHYLIEVHLFTDFPEPELIAQKYQDALADNRLHFVYRATENFHNKNVVEDYCAMAACDYLIRSSSLIAKASQLLGNHKMVLYPGHGYWDGEKVIIDLIHIVIKNN
jgi:hypothetical protein